ncbi:hypothetical protein, partial [Maridesulfovibrio zosterae]|uniref:hypothetical protein n=1 Tax=Maridesulfovibrio zosterae TaxID=82171 RepID=UPI003CCB77B3
MGSEGGPSKALQTSPTRDPLFQSAVITQNRSTKNPSPTSQQKQVSICCHYAESFNGLSSSMDSFSLVSICCHYAESFNSKADSKTWVRVVSICCHYAESFN